MRICSFLPSATEILFALGADDDVAGVTFECDYPPAARVKPVVVHSAMQSGLSAREIDDAVRSTAHIGGSLYFVDWPLLEAIAPDVIVAQDLCRVCAISTPSLACELGHLANPPRVLSLTPHSLADVVTDIATVGAALGRSEFATTITEALQARLEHVRYRSHALTAKRRRRVLCLEWLDPLYQGGHWIPEMVELAGGEAVLAEAGAKSIRIPWEAVVAADPEVIVLMPCGYDLEGTIAQYESADWQRSLPAAWQLLSAVRCGEVYAVDGNAYFSRPGPRLLQGLEILSAILQGENLEKLPANSMRRL